MLVDLASDPVYTEDHFASGLFCQIDPEPGHYVWVVISFVRLYENAGVQQISRGSFVQAASPHILDLALSKLSDFNPVR